MIFVGVDPGRQGAIVAVDRRGQLVGRWRMPLADGRGRDAIDLLAVRGIVEQIEVSAAWAVERLDPLPASMGGSFANHARGEARGWAWLLTGMRLRHELVRPQAWQAFYREGKRSRWDKARALKVALGRGWPGSKHDGEVDAFLLAHWAANRGAWAWAGER